MKIDELMGLTLRELLDGYVAIRNLECGYFYGIVPVDLVEELLGNYNIDEEYPEAFAVENIIDDELIFDGDKELLSYDKLEKIMCNLGITKKGAENE